jgi:hypothetical protein
MKHNAGGSFVSEEENVKKVISIHKDLYFPLEIIDGAIYSALTKLGYSVSDADDYESHEIYDELDKIFGFEKKKRQAIREERLPSLILYHWTDKELGIVSGALGGIELRKKRENLTEITLFPPPSFQNETKAENLERQQESLRRSKEIIDQLEQEGYLGDKEKSGSTNIKDEQEQPKKLTRLQQGIIDAYQELKEDKVAITIDSIISRLSIKGVVNRYGESYTREWVTKQRKELEKMGHDIPL